MLGLSIYFKSYEFLKYLQIFKILYLRNYLTKFCFENVSRLLSLLASCFRCQKQPHASVFENTCPRGTCFFAFFSAVTGRKNLNVGWDVGANEGFQGTPQKVYVTATNLAPHAVKVFKIFKSHFFFNNFHPLSLRLNLLSLPVRSLRRATFKVSYVTFRGKNPTKSIFHRFLGRGTTRSDT